MLVVSPCRPVSSGCPACTASPPSSLSALCCAAACTDKHPGKASVLATIMVVVLGTPLDVSGCTRPVTFNGWQGRSTAEQHSDALVYKVHMEGTYGWEASELGEC